eukprot:m.34887 g.34887  ORF g.34887 m.34887 type:complete len:346 (+) comp17051_c0_seq1:93-1130(+)
MMASRCMTSFASLKFMNISARISQGQSQKLCSFKRLTIPTANTARVSCRYFARVAVRQPNINVVKEVLPPPQSYWQLLGRPTLFCGGIATVSLLGAAYYNVGTDHRLQRFKEYSRRTLASAELNGEHTWYDQLKLMWDEESDSRRMLFGVIASYAVVLGLWKIPQLNKFMFRNFTHTPFSGKLQGLVTCHFSHFSILHMGFNSMALFTFGSHIVEHLGVNQFLGFSMAAGMSSALLSQFHSVFIRSNIPGLGASGIIMGVIAMFALNNPEAVVFVPFLPFIQGSALTALGGLMLVDVIGVLAGWRMFGHAAHLGGSAFGVLYALKGDDIWEQAQSTMYELRTMLH